MKKNILSGILCMAVLLGTLGNQTITQAAELDANNYCSDISEYRKTTSTVIGFESEVDLGLFAEENTNHCELSRMEYENDFAVDANTYGSYALAATATEAKYMQFRINFAETYSVGTKLKFSVYFAGTKVTTDNDPRCKILYKGYTEKNNVVVETIAPGKKINQWVSDFEFEITEDTAYGVIIFEMKDSAGDPIFGENDVTVYIDNFAIIENAYTYPTKAGYVFAGWYKDEACKVSPVAITEQGEVGAYAKFVDKEVLSVKGQIADGTTLGSVNTVIRLLTTVDSVNYRLAGFDITVGGKTASCTTKRVYSQIYEYVDESNVPYTPYQKFSEDSLYFVAYKLTAVPHSVYGTNITVTPKWTTLDGTVVYGEAKSFDVNEVAEVPNFDNGITFENINEHKLFTEVAKTAADYCTLSRVSYADLSTGAQSTKNDKNVEMTAHGEYALQATKVQQEKTYDYMKFTINFGKTYPAGTKLTFHSYVEGTSVLTSVADPRYSIECDSYLEGTKKADLPTAGGKSVNKWKDDIAFTLTTEADSCVILYSLKNSGTSIFGDNPVNIYLDNFVMHILNFDGEITLENITETEFFTEISSTNDNHCTLSRVAYADTTLIDTINSTENGKIVGGEYGLLATKTKLGHHYMQIKVNFGKTYPAGTTFQFAINVQGENAISSETTDPRYKIAYVGYNGTTQVQASEANGKKINQWVNDFTFILKEASDNCIISLHLKNHGNNNNSLIFGSNPVNVYLDNFAIIAGASTTVTAGQKLYFGAVTEANALTTKIYGTNANYLGTISASDLTLIESFGGSYGIYCYTVPANVGYVSIPQEAQSEYYTSILKNADDTTSKDVIVDAFIDVFDVPQPSDPTALATLAGKSALFVGDSITRGQEDHNHIYSTAGWAGRIGYYYGMTVKNNGVSGACISNILISDYGNERYIYNNLAKEQGNTYNYVIMHGLYNDAARGVDSGLDASGEVPSMLGPLAFEAAYKNGSVDESTFVGGLELMFYTAKQNHSTSKLGFIINFQTETNVNLANHVTVAKKVCDAWGIQYLDLYSGGSPAKLPDGTEVNLYDKLHPSSAGYDNLYTKIADWMATLQ